MAAADVLAALLAAARHVNPAVALCLEIRRLEAAGDLSPEVLLALRPRIDAAIPRAVEEAQEMQRAWRAVRQAEPIPAVGVPAGF